MTIYLHDIPLAQAQACWDQALSVNQLAGVLGIDEIPLDETAAGRILAEAVWAKSSSPHYHAAAMDGFAVRSQETQRASPATPIVLNCSSPGGTPSASYMDTGDPLPSWADAVIPIENVEALDENGKIAADPRLPDSIRIRSGSPPWQFVRPLGEDIVASQLVLPPGHLLRPVDLGAIAASGATSVRVTRRPRVAIIPTGSELVPLSRIVAGQPPLQAGEIIEFNSIVLASQVNQWGGQAERYPITPDDEISLRARVQEAAARNDLILLNAGSSAGSQDYSARTVTELGELLVHGIAIRPGHPVIMGLIHTSPVGDSEQVRKTPIIGVPGYPVSAALTGEIFVEPLIARWLGRAPLKKQTVTATLTRKITSPAGDDDYLRVAVGRVGSKLLAAPLARGSGVITSLVKADGLVVIPAGAQGLPAGAEVKVHLYSSPEDLESTILAIGSHDLALDLLAQQLSHFSRRLISANVGSLGGLLALQRAEAHLAGTHLLDPATGDYNVSYLERYLPKTPVVLLRLVNRTQGLMVLRGNPKGIYNLEDLARPDVRIVNRQRGAGTRVLLDYHLANLGITPEILNGYSQEEFTHLAVAAAVSSGRADAALGIAAAAGALELDFVPLFVEPYELAIPAVYYDSELFAPLLAILQDPAFRRAVTDLPGYDVSGMGEVTYKHLA